jgi:hypothetical protein
VTAVVEAAGLVFPVGAIDAIRTRIEAAPDLGRTALSRIVCEDLDFRNTLGQPRELACRLALRELEGRGFFQLPEAQTTARKSMPARVESVVGFDKRLMRCSLEALGEVRLIAVVAADGWMSDLWNEMMAAHHYLGYTPLVGAQMRYVIESEHYGWLGAFGFAASARRLAARDRFIDWSDRERRNGLQRIVSNTRFLILPWVEVKNLASHVIARVTRRLPQDWQSRYGYAPVLLETFVDAERFDGTCYRAANWIDVGQSSGRGRQDRKRTARKSRKQIFLYPLCTDWRTQLGIAARVSPPQSGDDWIDREFGNCKLGDPRRTRRLVSIVRDFYARPQASVPLACNGDVAKVKAVYRFMNSKKVTPSKLLDEHCRETIVRMGTERVVLAVQDTTTLNYTAHDRTKGIGPIGVRTSSAVGLILHDTIAVTPTGLTLGVLDAQVWVRDWDDKKPNRPIEEKESVKWLRSYEVAARAQAQLKDTLVVSTGDRESDIYELFALVAARESGPALLVRANGDRYVDEEHKRLWAHMESQKLAGYRELVVPPRPARGSKPARVARTARLEVRFATAVLQPPDGKKKLGKIRFFAVYAREENPLDPEDPIEWMLLTTVEVKTFEQACEKLDWYAERWQIEVYHRTLKSGCRIEERQHHTARTLENCLAIDMVIAARILHLTWIGRTCPDLPCTIYFADNQWKALYCFLNKTPVAPKEEPAIREVIGWIAKLGGHLGRKCDGPPGTKALWIGLPRMDDIAEFFKVFAKLAEGP